MLVVFLIRGQYKLKEKKSILFIHHNRHSGGASKSLFGYLNSLKDKFDIHLIFPKGTVSKDPNIKNFELIPIIGVSQFDNSEIGFYQGRRWLVLIREFFFFFPSIFSILKLKNKNFAVVHLNEISLIFIGVIARLVFSCPIILHVRTVQNNKWNLRSKLISILLNKFIDQIICIDTTVLNSLKVYKIKKPIEVVRNSFEKNGEIEKSKKFERNQITKVAIVSNFLIYKGIFDFYEAANILKETNRIENIEFQVYGDNFREMNDLKGKIMQFFGFQFDVSKKLKEKIKSDSLEDHFILKGFADDLEKVYENIDILCFPSHLNAVGRPVIEAGIHGKPSIVSLRDKENCDYLINDSTGIIIDEKNPSELANSIYDLHKNIDKRLLMGKKAFGHIQNLFSHQENLDKFETIIGRVTN